MTRLKSKLTLIGDARTILSMQAIYANLWMIWIGAAILFALFEVTVPHFGLIFAAGAALVAAAASRSVNLPLQLVIFAAALLVGLLFLRPRIVKKIQSKTGVPSRTERLIGKRGKVTVEIDSHAGQGRVEVEGEDWAATSQTRISVNSIVTVEGADGIVLLVKEG